MMKIVKTSFVTSLAKWLTGKSRTQQVEIGNLVRDNISNIFVKQIVRKQFRRNTLEIMSISFSSKLVYFRSKYTFTSKLVHSQMKSTYSRKQVNKGKACLCH